MLRELIHEGRKAGSLQEALCFLLEVTPYVMQTGPRGGRYYHDDQGKRHYRELTPSERRRAKAGGAGAAPRSREQYDQLWMGVSRRGVDNPRAVATALRGIFGDKAPTPDDMKNMFSAQGVQAELTYLSPSGGMVRAGYTVRDQDGTRIGTMTRQFEKKNGKPHVYHAYFELNENAQGGGRCGAMFGQALKTYQKMGVETVGVSASLTTGPYAWARFGFQPDEYEMNSIRREFTSFLEGPPIQLSAAKARQIVEKHGKDLHALSNVSVQSTQLDPRTGKEVIKTIKAGKDFLIYSRNGKPRDWKGVANLKDPKTLARWEEQASKGVAQRKEAIRKGEQNKRAMPGDAQLKKWEETRKMYTNAGKYHWEREQASARELQRQRQRGQRGATPAAAPAPAAPAPASAIPAADSATLADRARRFGTTPEQEKEIDQNTNRTINAEATRRRENIRLAKLHRQSVPIYLSTIEDFANKERRGERDYIRARDARRARSRRTPTGGGAGVSPADQAAAQARTAKRRAARRAQTDPRAQDLIRQGQQQVARARAQTPPAQPSAQSRATSPRPASGETPEQAHARRAQTHGTTVAQERRIDQRVQRKRERELLKRREKRQLAQVQGEDPPTFVPIRDWEKKERAAERARIRR